MTVDAQGIHIGWDDTWECEYPFQALAVLPSLEGSPRWLALDECLRSLLAGPVDTRAAIKHAKEASAG